MVFVCEMNVTVNTFILSCFFFFAQTPAMKKQQERHLPSPPTLDSIITEYLREQHARCHNPVTTCPPFSLFTPHRCPEPKQRRQALPNFTARLGSRVLYPKYGGVDRGCLDRHLIFSRYRAHHPNTAPPLFISVITFDGRLWTPHRAAVLGILWPRPFIPGLSRLTGHHWHTFL